MSDTGNIVLKSRVQREEKFMREFLALFMWRSLLEHYNDKSVGEEGVIRSPEPLAVNFVERSICMTYVPGEPLLFQYSSSQRGIGRLAAGQLIANSAYRLGRLHAIKTHEGLVHGDFEPRHLLVTEQGSLAVIDVESSYIGNPEDTDIEHRGLLEKVENAIGLGRKAVIFNRAFKEGWDGFNANQERVIEDIVSSCNLGEKPGYNIDILRTSRRLI